ncbi:WPP domain-associated protein [Raphanus sativus]|uniref:WPP domain-associated protein n=1 Tax=Raphanus sativus TaxID=3726 RepID=A0A9W3CQ90_RAPSA|nr:WPP domain-associated protein [Raphanus sativus]KAJ4870973.1 WPP domain-associated protein [Raphanus sativus]
MEVEEFVMVEDGSSEPREDKLSVEVNGVPKENENLNVDFLEDFDSYWDDVNDRLIISRVVNDSILKGMVTAIESEAAEKIAQKEIELSRARETLSLYHVGSEENNEVSSNGKVSLDTSDGSLNSLKNVARKQLVMLVEELTSLRKYVHVNRADEIGSSTVDKMLDSLKSILETVLKRKNETELPSLWWQQEHDFQKGIESAVVTTFVRSLKDEYQQRLLEKEEAEFGVNNKSSLLGNIKEISGLRQELEAIRKALSDHENGDIEAGEVGDRKRVEQLHRKMSASLSSALDTNGKHDVGSVPENFDTLKHLTPIELINHFNTEMNQMKRDHDYEIQEMTEQCFTFKRKYLNLKERGSFSFVGKGKELDALKKKIPSVISKLDKILAEDERLVSEGKNNAEFKSRLDSLLLENRQLKDSLADAAEKISQLSQVEADHQKLIRKFEVDADDSCFKASIAEDISRCFLSEFLSQIRSANQETDLEHSMVREAYELKLKDLESKADCERNDDFVDSCVESFIMEECSSVIYKEALKEADKKIVELKLRVTENEEALKSELVDKERLNGEIHWLECLVMEKEGLVQTAESNLAAERKKLEVVSQQINDLKSQTEQQQREIQEKTEAVRVMSARESEKIKGYEKKISDLRRELDLARESWEETKDEKRKTEEKLSATKAEKESLRKQILSLDLVPQKFMQGFNSLEAFVAEKTQKTNSRLKNMHSQVSDLAQQINELKGKASMYKQRFEKKSSDLQKAEAEVDLLGDEVETLLDLLEKIYIALDHYSPVLKHYPGIIEILKLVRRELSGEAKRPPAD